MVIGLYHRCGRHPFIDHFAVMKRGGATEDEMSRRLRALENPPRDESHLRSWFRDRLQHSLDRRQHGVD